LKHIESTDPLAKVLIYCQWDALKGKLLSALRAVKLGCLTLDGNPKQIASAVEQFSKQGKSTSSTGTQNIKGNSFILLCSLEHKAAGLNLQVANHVMFVHPFFSPITDRPASWEAQAVGRVLRPGQMRQVCIWRFVALDTIEQELLVRNNTTSWRDHYSPRSTAQQGEDAVSVSVSNTSNSFHDQKC
jgi:SNF2 family DNA or RNA helicase